MKKIYIIIPLIVLSLLSCSENERMTYEDKAGLYFTTKTGITSEDVLNTTDQMDSLVWSFTMTKENETDINLKLWLLGRKTNYDRKFRLAVDPSSTAVEGVHYKALENQYTLKANESEVIIPIRVSNAPELTSKIVTLIVRVVEDDTFTIGYPAKGYMRLFITDQLVKPSYWEGILEMYFAEYSKVKHQICIDLMEHDFPLNDANLDYSYYMKIGRKAALYFTINQVYDENDQLIQTWDPF